MVRTKDYVYLVSQGSALLPAAGDRKVSSKWLPKQETPLTFGLEIRSGRLGSSSPSGTQALHASPLCPVFFILDLDPLCSCEGHQEPPGHLPPLRTDSLSVHLKLIQHCKPTMLQKKEKKALTEPSATFFLSLTDPKWAH